MELKGYAYVPIACEKKKCDLHVAFHGCGQDTTSIGFKFIEFTGYNQYAEANDVVILYPQIKPNKEENTNGCWDFYGYSDRSHSKGYYATKLGF